MPVKDTLIRLLTCNRQIIGTGSKRNRRSNMRLLIPVPNAASLMLWHLAFLMLLSQDACTGTHSNMESQNEAIHYIMTRAPATKRAARKCLLTLKSRWYSSSSDILIRVCAQ